VHTIRHQSPADAANRWPRSKAFIVPNNGALLADMQTVPMAVSELVLGHRLAACSDGTSGSTGKIPPPAGPSNLLVADRALPAFFEETGNSSAARHSRRARGDHSGVSAYELEASVVQVLAKILSRVARLRLHSRAGGGQRLMGGGAHHASEVEIRWWGVCQVPAHRRSSA